MNTASDTARERWMRLVRPAAPHLISYCAALRRSWSPDNVRGAIAAEEQLEQIANDAATFLANQDDPEAKGPHGQQEDEEPAHLLRHRPGASQPLVAPGHFRA